MRPVVSVLLLTAGSLVRSSAGRQCAEPENQAAGHTQTAHAFEVTWPRDAEDAFSEPCCGDLFHCTTRSATCIKCGDRNCDALRHRLPGCPDDHCTRFGLMCDGTNDCSNGADEAYCSRILATFDEVSPLRFNLPFHQSFSSVAGVILHDVELDTCAAYCFFHGDGCQQFSYSRASIPSGFKVPGMRRLQLSKCHIGLSGRAWVTRDESSRLFRSSRQRRAALRRHAHQPGLPADCGRRLVHKTTLRTADHVINGQSTLYGEYPWQVRLRRAADGAHHCGGVLITDRAVLTAAHCLKGSADLYEVVVGDHDRNKAESEEMVFTIEEMFPHEEYRVTSKSRRADLAIIKLNTRISAVKFSRRVQPACLPPPLSPPPGPTTTCVVSGWGSTTARGSNTPDRLRGGRIPVVSESFCGTIESHGDLFEPEYMICAGIVLGGGIDACSGDSGGGLVCQDDRTGRWHVAGIVAFGDEQCGQAVKVGIYTRVQAYNQWIVDNL